MVSSSTQNLIDIAGIKDGIVILRNGGYRIILDVAATNFALKSEQEQNSLIFQYQSFLNSLHFPIEIVIRSKRLDLSPYLKKMDDLVQKQENELLKIQTIDYIEFVSKLIELANIMKKNFYVSVPWNPINLKKPNLFEGLFHKEKSVVADMRISEEEFKHNSDQLKQRAQIIASGLGSMGLRCTQLSTEEIIEAFYQIYNPEIASKERFENAGELSAPVVASVTEKKGEEQKPAEKPKEEVIDNSAVVQDWQKEQAALRQQEIEKEGERQIGMTQPAAAKTSEQPKTEAPAISPTDQQSKSINMPDETKTSA